MLSSVGQLVKRIKLQEGRSGMGVEELEEERAKRHKPATSKIKSMGFAQYYLHVHY